MTPFIVTLIGLGFLFLMGLGVILGKFYRRVEQGQALIVNTLKAEPSVTFTGTVVYPIIHRAEVMDISVKTIEIDRRGKEGLICKDNIRADIRVTFFVRVNKTREDVLKVAQSIGCARASAQTTLENLFSAKFSEALKTVGKRLEFVDLYTKREEFKNEIIDVIGRDLNGYVLEDAAIDFLEQTPLSSLDPNNILDAQGISKITELTTVEHIRTNEYQNVERKLIKKQDVEAIEAILELERQRADAENKQQREIATVKARELAETMKVQAEERLKSETARIAAEQAIMVSEENKAREVEFANKNRQRVILVETERVEKDRSLEAIIREREVELNRIAKEKALEVERKAIADIIRERIAVEKTVAEEEERIKAVRVVQEAERTKAATIITAEAEAQEKLVKDIKAAEASEQAAKFRAKEKLVMAEADLEAAHKHAQAKIRLAEGVQAEAAASGLAEVKVKEADALAHEKHGLAEAVVIREKGQAEGLAIKQRLVAEAEGLAQKADAMKALDASGRGHEEYRLQLDKQRAVELEAIRMRAEVATAQAQVLADALKTAKIDIVGGDGAFFERITSAITMGKSVDGLLDHSEVLKTLLADYMSGKANLPADLKDVLTRPAISSQDVQHLTVSALLARLMSRTDEKGKAKLRQLLETAESLGVDGIEAQ